jgi:hypothetical protein
MTIEEAIDHLVAHDLGFVVRPGDLVRATGMIIEIIDGKRVNTTPMEQDDLLDLVHTAQEAI